MKIRNSENIEEKKSQSSLVKTRSYNRSIFQYSLLAKNTGTKDFRQMGRGGFEISDVTGQGRGRRVCENSEFRKY